MNETGRNQVWQLLDRIATLHPDVEDITRQIAASFEKLLRSRGQRFRVKRDGFAVTYRVVTVGGQEMLYEVRPRRGLRIGRDSFTAVVDVLVATSGRVVSFTDISRTLKKSEGAGFSDFRVGLVLRFLRQAQPAILIRERARYRTALDRPAFLSAADALWRAHKAEAAAGGDGGGAAEACPTNPAGPAAGQRRG